jgi:hypothetical protein
VIFEGAVRAVLSVSPPSPVAGQTVDVALQLRTRRGPITDPDELHGLAFVAGLRGTGFSPLTTDLPDREGNGQHEGRLTVPSTATGRLRFTGSVSGVGISGDQRTYDTLVATVPPPVQAELVLADKDPEVVVGSTISGTAEVVNNSGVTQQLRLLVAQPATGTSVTLSPELLPSVAPGSSNVPFSLTFTPNTVLGPNQATVRLTNASNPSQVVAELPVARTVTEKPLLPPWLFWVLASVGIALVAGIVALLLKSRIERRKRRPHGLEIQLVHKDSVRPTVLKPKPGAKDAFHFVISPDPLGLHRPAHPDRNAQDVFTVARAGGGLTITRQGGTPESVQAGVPWDLERDDLHVLIKDRSTRASARLASAPPGRSSPSRSSPTPTPAKPSGGPEASKTTPHWY